MNASLLNNETFNLADFERSRILSNTQLVSPNRKHSKINPVLLIKFKWSHHIRCKHPIKWKHHISICLFIHKLEKNANSKYFSYLTEVSSPTYVILGFLKPVIFIFTTFLPVNWIPFYIDVWAILGKFEKEWTLIEQYCVNRRKEGMGVPRFLLATLDIQPLSLPTLLRRFDYF